MASSSTKPPLEPSAPPMHGGPLEPSYTYMNTPPPAYAPRYETEDSDRPPPYSPPEQKNGENGNKSNNGSKTDVSKQDKRSRKRKRNRVLYCLGWLLCCPVFTLCWAVREPHVDEEDLREDDCYPCIS